MEVSTILISLFIYAEILIIALLRKNKLHITLSVCSTVILCLSSNWICKTVAKIPTLFASIKEWINHLPMINISFNGHVLESVNVLGLVIPAIFAATVIITVISAEISTSKFQKRMKQYKDGSVYPIN